MSPGVFTVVHVAEVDHGSPDRAPSRGKPGIVQGFRGWMLGVGGWYGFRVGEGGVWGYRVSRGWMLRVGGCSVGRGGVQALCSNDYTPQA